MSAESQIEFDGMPDDTYVRKYIDSCNTHRNDSVCDVSSSDFKTWQGTKKTFKFNFMFDTDTLVSSRRASIQTIVKDTDLFEMFERNTEFDTTMKHMNLVKAAVVKTSIAGSTFEKRSKFALELFDANGRHMYETQGYKESDNDIYRAGGIPLYSNTKVLMEKDDAVDKDLRLYGEISMDDIEKNVTTIDYADPHSGVQRRIYSVPKFPNGVYFMYALEKANTVFAPGQSTASTDPNNPAFFQLPSETYEAVVAAYRKKLNNDVHFYDLSEISAVLKPLSQPTTPTGMESISIAFEVYLAPKEHTEKSVRDSVGIGQRPPFVGDRMSYNDVLDQFN